MIPADLLLLETDNIKSGRCYIETKGIDGETNSKERMIPSKFHKLKSSQRNLF